MNPSLFYSSTLGFILGVLIATLTPLSWYFAALLVLVGISVAVIAVQTSLRDTGVIMLACLLVFAGFGVVRHAFSEPTAADRPFEEYVGEKGELEGVVQRASQGTENATLVVQSKQFHIADEKPVSGETLVRVTAPRYPEYEPDDRVKLTGALEKPESFKTETGRVFPYDMFLVKDGIFYVMYYPKIERVSENEEITFTGILREGKNIFVNGIRRVFPEPQASFAASMLAGERETLPGELEGKFRRTGLVHIIVLSGFHVTLVSLSVIVVLKYLGAGIWTRSVLGLGAIVLFAIAVGGGATVLRASIMGGLVLLAHLAGRRGDALRALVLAVTIMVFVNPLILVHGPSFQFSVMATLGLVLTGSIIERWLWFIPEWLGMREIATATIATQVGIWPLLLYMTGSLSLVSIPVNLLALPAVAPAMAFAFAGGLLGIAVRWVALPFAAVAYVLLGYILILVRTFDTLPYSHIVVPPMPVWVPFLIYALLGAGILWYHRRFSLELGVPRLAERLE
jgi:competence protein ComEC